MTATSTDGGSIAPNLGLYDGYSESFPRLFPKDSRSLLQGSDENKYDLFPMTDLEELYAMLGDPSVSDEESAREVSAFLQEHRDCFWLKNAPARVTIDPNGAIQQMRRWPDEDEYRHGAAQHVKLLKHPDHVPDNIFKLNLYPTIAPGLRYTQDGTSGSLGEFTVRFADIAEKLLTNSMFELNAAWDVKTGDFYDFNAQYYFFRGSYSGLYAGLGVRQERLSATSDMTAEQRHNIVQKVGADPPTVEASTRQRYGLDVGWALTFNLRNHLFFDFKAGIRGDIFHTGPTDFEIARGAQDKFRFVFGLAIRYGFFHPRHPLSY